MGANLVFHGTDVVQTENHALQVAKESDKVYISPYNDFDIICGQGTMAVEILD